MVKKYALNEFMTQKKILLPNCKSPFFEDLKINDDYRCY